MKGFWKTDWFLGLMVALVLLAVSNRDLMQSLERKAYDLGVRAASRTPYDKIAVIAIDDQSIANIGRWPWSREVHAKMTDLLTNAKAKVIGYTVFFFEPQTDPGLVYIGKLGQLYAGSKFKIPDDPESAQFEQLLAEAEQNLNTDRKLAESFKKAGNVLLPMVFERFPFEPQGNPDKPLPDYIAANSLTGVADKNADQDLLPLPAINPFYPIADLAKSAVAIGHLNGDPDVDGGIRTEPMVIRYYDKYFPSISVMLAAKSLNLNVADIKVKLGEEVAVGKLHIRTDPQLKMYSFFYGDRDDKPAFAVDSFYDVYSGKIPADKYRDKIVLIGATASGVGQAKVTPISPAMAPVFTMAHSVSSILKEDFFVAPNWGGYVKFAGEQPGDEQTNDPRALLSAAGRAFRADEDAAHVDPADEFGDVAAGRPFAVDHQALPGDGAWQGQVRRDLGGIQPHARHRLPGAGTARPVLGQVPPGADVGSGDG